MANLVSFYAVLVYASATMSPFDLPDDVEEHLARSGPGGWVSVPQEDGRGYFVSASIPALSEDAVRREVNKGLDSSDKHGSKPLDLEAFHREARAEYEFQAC